MNLDTREWVDGVLTSVAREVVKDTSKRAWIVCDGDVVLKAVNYLIALFLGRSRLD